MKVFKYSVAETDPGETSMVSDGESMLLMSGPVKDTVTCPLCRHVDKTSVARDADFSGVSLFYARMEFCPDKGRKLKYAIMLERMIKRLLDGEHLVEKRQLVLYMLGDTQLAKRSFDEAIASFAAALSFDTSKSQAKDRVAVTNIHNNLGWALEQKGDLDAAGRSYREAIATDTDDPKTNVRAYLNLGRALRDTGKSVEAITVLKSCLGLARTLRDHCLNEPALLNTNDEPIARDIRTILGGACDEPSVIKAKLENCPSYNEIAVALSSVDQSADAIHSWRNALAMNPLDATAHYNIGVLLRPTAPSQHCCSADFNAAIESFATATKLDPLFAPAHALLGNTLQQKWHTCWRRRSTDGSTVGACATCMRPCDMQCVKCKLVAYCNPICQAEHWPSHKAECRRWRKAGGDHIPRAAAMHILELARVSIKRAISIDPLCADFHVYLGHVLGQQLDYHAALSSFKAARSVDKQGLQKKGWLDRISNSVRFCLEKVVEEKKQMDCQHVLEKFWAPVRGYYCPRCKRQNFAVGTAMYSCTKGCHWDLCCYCFEDAGLSAVLAKDPNPESHLLAGRHHNRSAWLPGNGHLRTRCR
jgi:tetratricopeptide (TPR) repeat protein